MAGDSTSLTADGLAKKRQQLSALLAKVQADAKLSGFSAAAAAGRSQPWWSKVVHGKLMPARADVVRFLGNVNTVDAADRWNILKLLDELEEINDEKRLVVQHAHSRAWALVSERECRATRVIEVASQHLPDLLRTDEYHRSLLRHLPPHDREACLQALDQRRKKLPRDPRRSFVFLLHEHVLLRPVDGSTDTMREQFEHLIKIVKQRSPLVRIGIIPTTARVPSGHPMSFRVVDSALVIVTVLPTGRLVTDARRTIARFERELRALETVAIKDDKVVEYLQEVKMSSSGCCGASCLGDGLPLAAVDAVFVQPGQ